MSGNPSWAAYLPAAKSLGNVRNDSRRSDDCSATRTCASQDRARRAAPAAVSPKLSCGPDKHAPPPARAAARLAALEQIICSPQVAISPPPTWASSAMSSRAPTSQPSHPGDRMALLCTATACLPLLSTRLMLRPALPPCPHPSFWPPCSASASESASASASASECSSVSMSAPMELYNALELRLHARPTESLHLQLGLRPSPTFTATGSYIQPYSVTVYSTYTSSRTYIPDLLQL